MTHPTDTPTRPAAVTDAEIAEVRHCLDELDAVIGPDAGCVDMEAWQRLTTQWSAVWLARVGAPRLLDALTATQAALAEAQREREALPTIVCLCGSTRFMDAFHEANRRLSLEGKIVLTVEIVTYDGAADPQRADPDQKRRLDELHLRKIDLADEVLVLNVGGYVGPSTQAEIDYARAKGKTIRWLEEATHDPA
jgi:hypothetical protein